jgi:pimeloyl-ACP methyl ester carboxylesterase
MAVLPCLLSRTIQAAQVAAASKPYLLHLNGIGGERVCDHWLLDGLRQGGFNAEMEVYDWTTGRIGIEALQGRELHSAQSHKVAEKLTAFARQNPRRPIYITSHSGGCGVIVWALEQLPEDVKINTLVMIAPALSPDYDLSKALSHVKGRAYVFSSPHDTIVLGTGTKLFGTIDGQKVEAAGLNGFVRPEQADPEQYKKLSPQPYSSQWLAKYGNAGSHICSLRPMFAREYIATLLLTGTPPADEPTPVAATTQPVQPTRTPVLP